MRKKKERVEWAESVNYSNQNRVFFFLKRTGGALKPADFGHNWISEKFHER